MTRSAGTWRTATRDLRREKTVVPAGHDQCKYLTDDDRCRIYLNRPKVCREYTTDNCEYDGEWTFDKVFETPEQLWEYAEAVLRPKRPRSRNRSSHCRSLRLQ